METQKFAGLLRQQLLLAVVVLTAAKAYPQSFYDTGTIQEIKIYFGFANWDYRMDTATTGGDTYTMADSVVINGLMLDSVGVKYKGNSSYNANNNKNPMHIEFDEFKNQDFQGMSDIKLGNMFKDPTCVREPLSFQILSNYMHCPRSNFAKVWINGTYVGMYNNTEAINNDFTGDHFYSTGRPFFKCVGTQGGSPTLQYLGANESSYYSAYEMKSDTGYTQLMDLCNTLNNNTASIENILDVDRALWMLAFNNVCINFDSYTGGIGHNWYLYQDQNARFNPIIWDLNENFGVFSRDASNTQNSLTMMINFSPVFGSTLVNRPLISKLLANPMYKKMYIAHMRTITNEQFANGSYLTQAQALQSTVNTTVQGDPNTFFTYSQFQTSLTSNITTGGPGGGTIPGLQNLMNPRATYLAGTTEFQQTPPAISNLNHTPASPNVNTTVTITATVTNANLSDVFLGYRYTQSQRFTRIQMHDDGAHGDGAPGDNVFGATVNVSGSQVQYYVYAQNNNAGIFSPERAEHNWHTLNATIVMAGIGDLVINEFMARNNSVVMDAADSSFEDWVEIRNNTASPVSLAGLFLSDDYLNPTKWEFPSTGILQPGGYVAVWCDEDSSQGEYHANFKLSATGEQLVLGYTGGFVLDSLSFGAMNADISWQRCPDGTGSFSPLYVPTWNAANTCTTIGTDDPAENAFSTWPSPATEKINIISDKNFSQVSIISLHGQEVNRFESQGARSAALDVSQLPDGLYLVVVDRVFTRKIIVQH